MLNKELLEAQLSELPLYISGRMIEMPPEKRKCSLSATVTMGIGLKSPSVRLENSSRKEV